MKQEDVTMNWDRAYGEINGYIPAPNTGARYEQDGYYFDGAGKLMPGQKYYLPTPPQLVGGDEKLAWKSTIGRTSHIIEGKENVVGLLELDDWMDRLPGSLEGLNKLQEYARKTADIKFGRTVKLQEMKKLVRAIYIVRKTHAIEEQATSSDVTVGRVADDSTKADTLEA